MQLHIGRYIPSPLQSAGTRVAARLANASVFAGVLTGLFLAVGMVGVFHHEMWRDEMHAWLLARDSSSLWNVFQTTRYEAHFALWRLILYPLARCTHNPLAVQILSLLVAAGTVWIVARFSPFRRWEKVLFSFGYFTLYEYCIIAQDYTLIVILIFSFCALYRRRTRSYLGLSVVLFLLANTLPYGFVIAMIFAALLVFDWLLNEEGRRLRSVGRGNLNVSGLIVLVGMAVAGLQLSLMKQSPSTTWSHSFSVVGLVEAMANLWRAYVPIPKGFPIWMDVSWGSNLFMDGIPQGKWLGFGLSVGLFVISAGLLVRRPAAVFLYLLGITSLLGIQFAISVGAPRHTGFLFLLFIASLWIWQESAEWELSAGRLRRFGVFFERWRNPLVVGLLVIHVIAGAGMFSADLALPFSPGKHVARFLRDRGLSNLTIVGSRDTRMAPLAGYLDKKIYYPARAQFGSYIDYGKPVEEVRPWQVVMKAWEYARQARQEVVLVVNDPIEHVTKDGATVRLQNMRIYGDGTLCAPTEAYFPPSTTIEGLEYLWGMIDEPCYIYLLRPD